MCTVPAKIRIVRDAKMQGHLRSWLISLSLLSTITVGKKWQPNSLSISTKSKRGLTKRLAYRNTRMWTDIGSDNQNLSTKKGRNRCGRKTQHEKSVTKKCLYDPSPLSLSAKQPNSKSLLITQVLTSLIPLNLFPLFIKNASQYFKLHFK